MDIPPAMFQKYFYQTLNNLNTFQKYIFSWENNFDKIYLEKKKQ